MTDIVEPATALRRLAVVQALQRELTWAGHRALVGEEIDGLGEGESRRGGGELMGRTRANVIANFTGGRADLRGRLASVRVEAASPNTVSGRFVSAKEPAQKRGDPENPSQDNRTPSLQEVALKVLSDTEASCPTCS